MFAFPRQEDIVKFNLEENKRYFHLIGLPMSVKSYDKEINTNLMPKFIRDASYKIYSSIFGNINKVFLIDHGDIDFEDLDFEKLKSKVEEINDSYDKDNVFVFLGGNHLISYFTIKALNPDLIIHFDAHPDVEYGELANYSFLRYLINEGYKVFSIGLCNGSLEEFEFLKNKNIDFFTSLDFYEKQNEIKEKLKERLKDAKRVYVTFDVDVLRYNLASFQPEALGIELFDLLKFLNSLKIEISNKLIGFDLVELDPTKDVNYFSTLMVTRLLIEALSIFNKI